MGFFFNMIHNPTALVTKKAKDNSPHENDTAYARLSLTANLCGGGGFQRRKGKGVPQGQLLRGHQGVFLTQTCLRRLFFKGSRKEIPLPWQGVVMSHGGRGKRPETPLKKGGAL